MIEVKLRTDQVDCVLEVLIYCMARFDGQSAVMDQQPAVRLACRLAKGRLQEIREIFEKAITDGPAAV